MEYKSVSKASLRMGVGIRTIQKRAKEGKIPGAKKVGRDRMFPVDEKMVEVRFKKKYPKAFAEIINIVNGFNSGWYKYHNRKTGRNVADNLTTTEFTIVMLYN